MRWSGEVAGVYGFSFQLAACRQIRDWSRRARRIIAGHLADPRVERLWGPRLRGWARTCAGLAAAADWHLRAAAMGFANPAAMVQLLAAARQTTAEVSAWLRDHHLTPGEVGDMEPERSVPVGQHKLPPLPYAYDALVPHIDTETMRLHHTRHHQSYVDGLNKAERMMARARETGDFALLRHWEREAAFNGAGHYLHTIFWHVMHPDGGGEPRGDLAAQIGANFGGFEPFRRHFSAAAEQVEAVGWALLVWAPRARRLEILQSEKHQNLSQWDVIPLLVLDVWEHAYYLQYRNDRRAYIDAWWNVVHWDHVAERFARARTLAWEPFAAGADPPGGGS